MVVSQNDVTQKLLLDYLIQSNSNLTDHEQKMFVSVAMAYGLNPFKREIYPVAYGSGDKRKLSIIVGYEIYLKRAERTGKLDGFDVSISGAFKKGKIQKKKFDGSFYDVQGILPEGEVSATCTVWVKGKTHPVVWTVWFDEYTQSNEMWLSKPRTMIKKVAIEQAFRIAFPDEMGGMPYAPEELPEKMINNTFSEAEIIPEAEKETIQPPPSGQPVGSATTQGQQTSHTKKDLRTPEEIKTKFDAYIQKKQTEFGASEVETILEKFRNDNGEFNPEKFITIAEALEKKFSTVKGAAK